MSLRNTSESYGSLAKWLHWISAILIIGMLIYGTIFTTVISKGPLRSELIGIHKSIGLLILALLIIRWIWRWINVQPKPLSITNPTIAKASHWFHESLYVAIAIMLLSGILLTAAHNYPIPFFGLFTIQTAPWFPKSRPIHEFFGDIHQIFAWIITGMLVLHVGAVIKHHRSYKDDTLKRML